MLCIFYYKCGLKLAVSKKGLYVFEWRVWFLRWRVNATLLTFLLMSLGFIVYSKFTSLHSCLTTELIFKISSASVLWENNGRKHHYLMCLSVYNMLSFKQCWGKLSIGGREGVTFLVFEMKCWEFRYGTSVVAGCHVPGSLYYTEPLISMEKKTYIWVWLLIQGGFHCNSPLYQRCEKNMILCSCIQC